MERAVFAKDVREGDLVFLNGFFRTITNVHVGHGIVFLEYQKSGDLFAAKYKPMDGIDLQFRPWPQGTSDADMREEVVLAVNVLMREIGHPAFSRTAEQLRDTLNAYLMGLREPAQGNLFEKNPSPTAGGTCDSSVVVSDSPSPYDLSDARHPANRQRR